MAGRNIRTFLSDTPELALWPQSRSYIRAAEDAIRSAEGIAVSMLSFSAVDRPPAEACIQQVLSCDIYVAVVGFRYGSLAPGYSISYAELEYQTARKANKTCLIFLIDDSLRPTLDSDLDQTRIIQFREKLKSELLVEHVGSPDHLELKLYRALIRHAQIALRGQPRHSIFLNYRRSDSPHAAHRLYDHLESRFGEGSTFIDLDQIEPGADFTIVLDETVKRCRAFIALIGPSWAPLRLEDTDDFVRRELEHALEIGTWLIPVLLDDARMPVASDLPASLAPLARRQAFDLRLRSFRSDCSKLSDFLQRIFD